MHVILLLWSTFVAAVVADAGSAVLNADMGVRAQALADRLITCDYVNLTGTFVENLWQSGNTIEVCAVVSS
jgi:hypothetical protein